MPKPWPLPARCPDLGARGNEHEAACSAQLKPHNEPLPIRAGAIVCERSSAGLAEIFQHRLQRDRHFIYFIQLKTCTALGRAEPAFPLPFPRIPQAGHTCWETSAREEPGFLICYHLPPCRYCGRIELLAGRWKRRWFGSVGQGRVFGTGFVLPSPKRFSL